MKKFQKVFALLCIALLVFLYILTFIAALLSKSEVSALFQVSLYCTIVLPILLYGLTILTRITKSNSKDPSSRKEDEQ